jgi:arsenate reductase (thioredoxin)
MRKKLFPGLSGTIGHVLTYNAAPNQQRIEILQQLVDFLRSNPDQRNLLFVCTHNSRRSHLAQYWAAAAACFYDIENVKTFSGGTETTALHPYTVEALKESNFEVMIVGEHPVNPQYDIILGGTLPHIEGFSKKIGDAPNPQTEFCAVMVCSEADEACPFVPGATARVSLPYIDPKVSDGTAKRKSVYHERSHEIAREMLWVFEQLTQA